MVDVEVKNSVKKYTSVRVPSTQPSSFGARRQPDRSATARRFASSAMPAAWQTRGVPSYDGPAPHGADVRSFGDILLDPVRWALSTKAHKIATATFAAILIAMILF